VSERRGEGRSIPRPLWDAHDALEWRFCAELATQRGWERLGRSRGGGSLCDQHCWASEEPTRLAIVTECWIAPLSINEPRSELPGAKFGYEVDVDSSRGRLVAA
jgi:hypothetical protein